MRFRATCLVTLLAAFATSAHSEGAATEYAEYRWPTKLHASVDLNRNGVKDHARLGVRSSSVGLLIRVDSTQLPIIDIPIDGSKQFAICPGSAATITVIPQSEAPLNALGEMPRGYRICNECMEIVVGGGDCDPVHFYWDITASEVAWWRE